MAKIKRIAHIAIIVEDLEQPLSFWRDALGLELAHITDVPEEAARVAFLPVGESEFELVQPTSADTGLGRFLEKRGAGLHHVCLEVEDLDAMLERLKGMDVQLINEAARTAPDGRKYAFIHPKAANGVLVELYELP